MRSKQLFLATNLKDTWEADGFLVVRREIGTDAAAAKIA
jgi:hypothetical protein